MTKVRYNLIKSNSKDEAKQYHIRLVFRYDGKRLVYYPGHTISKTDWNPKEQRARKTGALANLINTRLDMLAREVERIYLEHDTAGKVLPIEKFRQILDVFWRNRTNPRQEDVELLSFLETMPAGRHAAGELAIDSLRAYSTLLSNIRAFENARKKPVLFSSVDLDFLEDFKSFLQMRGSKPNTIAKMVKTLKSTMRLAVDRGLTTNIAFQSRRFTAQGEKVEHIYLNESDLQKLETAVLPESLANARDLFLMECCTGLRYIDLVSLTPDNFTQVDGVDIISILTKKTGVRVSIPVLPMARRILERLGGMPRAITNQQLNKRVKIACEIAGLIGNVVSVRIRAGKRIETVSRKCDLVTTHTARRSFATNEYLRAVREGRDWRPIMAITGHKREIQFFEYIRVSSEQNAVLFSNARKAG